MGRDVEIDELKQRKVNRILKSFEKIVIALHILLCYLRIPYKTLTFIVPAAISKEYACTESRI